MKNETMNALTKLFESVRETVTTTQNKIDGVIADAATENAEAFKYTEPYRSERIDDLRERADERIANVKTKGKIKIDALYASIETELRAWAKTPMPEAAMAMIDSYSKYDIAPSKAELDLMRETCQGSYAATRVLDAYARNYGVDTHFVSLETLNGMLRTAKAETINVINFYAGHMDEAHKYISTYLGLDCGISDKWHMLPMAENFMRDGADNVFTRLEKVLLDSTQDDFDILPDMRRQLDEIFADLEPDDRIRAARTLIESKSPLSNLLQLYDAKLYADAVTAIAADSLNASRNADKALHDAIHKSAEAYAENRKAQQQVKAVQTATK